MWSIGKSEVFSLFEEGKSSEEKIFKNIKYQWLHRFKSCWWLGGSGNKSYSEESFENYDANNNDSFANNDKHLDSYDNPSVNNNIISKFVAINSSSKFAQSEDRSNETQRGRDTSSKAKQGRFIQLVLHSLLSHANLQNHHLFHMIVMNSPSKISCLLWWCRIKWIKSYKIKHWRYTGWNQMHNAKKIGCSIRWCRWWWQLFWHMTIQI